MKKSRWTKKEDDYLRSVHMHLTGYETAYRLNRQLYDTQRRAIKIGVHLFFSRGRYHKEDMIHSAVAKGISFEDIRKTFFSNGRITNYYSQLLTELTSTRKNNRECPNFNENRKIV